VSVVGVVGEVSPGKGLRRQSQTIEDVSDKVPQRSFDHYNDTSQTYRGEGMMCSFNAVKYKYFL